MTDVFTGVFGMVLLGFLLILALLWFLLPFMVHGIQKSVNNMDIQLKAVNDQLAALNKSVFNAGYEQQKTNMILQQAHNIQVNET